MFKQAEEGIEIGHVTAERLTDSFTYCTALHSFQVQYDRVPVPVPVLYLGTEHSAWLDGEMAWTVHIDANLASREARDRSSFNYPPAGQQQLKLVLDFDTGLAVSLARGITVQDRKREGS